MATGNRWPPEYIASFRSAFHDLRGQRAWRGWNRAAHQLGCSAHYLRWAAGEISPDTWPGSIRLARRLRRSFGPAFAWEPPTKHVAFGPENGVAVIVCAEGWQAPPLDAIVLTPKSTNGAKRARKRKHKRYWRPCLPIELKAQAEAAGVEAAAAVKAEIERKSR